MHGDLLGDIAICIVMATALAFAAKALRQPLILAYVVAGVLIGPAQGFGWIKSAHEIEVISEIGLILLLFMIGLEIDLKKLGQSGTAVTVVGVAQFFGCLILGLLAFHALGFRFSDGDFGPLYLSVAAALSSTMIVVKLLYDKFELDTLPGRITLGILVLQDLWAILFIGLQPNLGNPSALVLLLSMLKAAALVACCLLASRYLLPIVFRSIAKLPELMLIAALGWCFGVSMVAAYLGLSREMGALIAGVGISTFPYNLDVTAKITSLRDFFVVLFFVALGAKIPRPTSDVLLLAVAGSVFVVASRLVSITPVLHVLKLGNRASIIPALNLSQVSEFSLVIAALGVGLGHIDQRVLSVIVFMMVITSVASTYVIQYNHQIYEFLQKALHWLHVRDLGDEPSAAPEAARPVVFIGFFRIASSLLHDLLTASPEMADKITVLDFNPVVKHELDRRGIHAIYGDVSHADTLHHAHVPNATVLLCTIPDTFLKGTSNARLLRQLRSMAPQAKIFVTAEVLDEARDLYRQGAAFVFVPRLMSVARLREAVLAALEGTIEQQRFTAHAELETRKEVLP